MSDRDIKRVVSAALRELGARYLRSIERIWWESDEEFWFTRKDGDGDVPERNLTWRVAQGLERCGFLPCFEVGSLIDDGSLDIVAISRSLDVTLLCEAKLLYGGGSQATKLKGDVDRLVKIDEARVETKHLPTRLLRVVVATTWTFSPRVIERENVVKRWRAKKGRPRALSTDSSYDRLLRALDTEGAQFIRRQSGWFSDKKGRSRQHFLAAVW